MVEHKHADRHRAGDGQRPVGKGGIGSHIQAPEVEHLCHARAGKADRIFAQRRFIENLDELVKIHALLLHCQLILRGIRIRYHGHLYLAVGPDAGAHAHIHIEQPELPGGIGFRRDLQPHDLQADIAAAVLVDAVHLDDLADGHRMFDRFELVFIGIRAVKRLDDQLTLDQAFVLNHFDILRECNGIAADDLTDRRLALPDFQHLRQREHPLHQTHGAAGHLFFLLQLNTTALHGGNQIFLAPDGDGDVHGNRPMDVRAPLADRAAIHVFRLQPHTDAGAIRQIFHLNIFGKRQVLLKASYPRILPNIDEPDEYRSVHCDAFA